MREEMKEIQAYLEAGRGFLKDGKHGDALDAFKRVLEIDPDNEYAILELGNLFLRSGNEEAAAGEYARVLKINPANEAALVELGKIFSRRKEYPKAKELCEKALKVNDHSYHAHLTLGIIHRIEGNYGESRKAFERAQSIDPGSLNAWLKRSDEVKGFRREKTPYRVFFTWGMNYECNYRCVYCYAPKPEQPEFDKKVKYNAVYPGLKKILEAWDAVAAKYGSCRIRLDGGEPSVYPDFLEIVRHLSRKHLLQINTNLSFDVEQFCREIGPERVRIDASFHSEYVSLDAFLAKINLLRKNNFRVVVSFVAYPPFIDRIPAAKSVFRERGVPLIIHPFSGDYQGKKYPRDYTPEEVKIIYHTDEKSKTELEWRKKKSNAGARGENGDGIEKAR